MSGLTAKIGGNPSTAASKDRGAGENVLPSVSLPKGGGAIKGIGEKFAVSAATGTSSFSIPIYTSPGRSGFGPGLSLSYNSGSGNGAFGLGWNLSLPSITRKTEKGLPQYRDAEESDIFVLSDAEDLVPVLDPLNGKPVVAEKDSCEIRRYRPRTEGLFARIERWTDKQSGESHWRSISRENITSVYGTTDKSRIAKPGSPSLIFSWLISESYDDKGNAIVYEYEDENGDNVDLAQSCERNRERAAGRYLKRIKYGNRVSRLIQPDLSKTEWLFELVLDYEEGHCEESEGVEPAPGNDRLILASASPGRAWSVRPDVFSSHRAGFEVRTYRRCRRALMFHRFAELGAEPYLVRSTEFEYDDLDYSLSPSVVEELTHPGSTRFASVMRSVIQSGFVRDETQGAQERGGARFFTYLKKSLPPLEFEYSRAAIQDEIRELDDESVANVPIGVDGTVYRWVDLDGEGVSGILTEQAGAWYYKPNWGDGRFGPQQKVAAIPATSGRGGRWQLLDLDGDGRLNMAAFAGPTPGYYERTGDENWEPFRTFDRLPNINWDDPNLYFVDLDGDGRADVLITEQDVFTWYPSLAEEGFGPAVQVRQSTDEEKGPRLLSAGRTESVYLADMCGDGLEDIVRIRNGEICYWPNLGHGRFGAKVAMDNAPMFDHPDQFDRQRIRLADIDGTGVTDIIYLGRDGARVYLNRSGNGWSGPRYIKRFPVVDHAASAAVVDLLGNGTSCLVWSSPLPGEILRPIRYIELTGGQKPHLLIRSANNLGVETHVHYASSTKFYLADRLAGKPWITKLPFPVHVVERVETYDRISGNRFVVRYAYHHGCYDGEEREFRGFGLVEQWDTETFAALQEGGLFPAGTNVDGLSHVPPVLTRSWFHTGIYLDRHHISDFYAGQEYYREPNLSDEKAKKLLLEDTILPGGMTGEEEREACRALRGSMLRQEIYALDGTDKQPHPYTVTEQNFTVKRLQPKHGNRHAVFFIHAREQLVYHYDRNPADPRVAHTITLATDDYGNVLKTAAIGYGRRKADPDLGPREQAEQSKVSVIYTEAGFTNPVDTDKDHHAPLPYETRSYELTGLTFQFGRERFTFAQLEQAGATAVPIDYHEIPGDDEPHKRLIERARTLYRCNDFTGALPAGQLQVPALPFESYMLAFTQGLLDKAYEGRAAESMLAGDGRYARLEGEAGWWIPSGRTFFSSGVGDTPSLELAYAKSHFFLPVRFQDPFHTDTTGTQKLVRYDVYDLLIQETCDALGNRITAGERHPDPSKPLICPGLDYRALQPSLVMDSNRNRTAVVFDALGMVAGTAVMGKPEDNPRRGDSLDGFAPDLNVSVSAAFLQDPLSDPHAILGRATTRLVYDLFAYQRTKDEAAPQPSVVCTLSRETHDADLQPGAQTKTQHLLSYSDGFGREIQKKMQAEALSNASNVRVPRWVGSGWTVYNNKGQPVRQFEPFFTDTPRFEFDVRKGVSPVLFYDPAGRVVCTLHPNRTWAKVVLDPWRLENWDVSDTVLSADPKEDPHVGSYFRRLQEASYLPGWFAQRSGGTLGPDEQEAARKAAVHAETPSVSYFDSLGRPFLTVAHNKCKPSDSPSPSEEFYRMRVVLDIHGNQREVIDAKERIVMRYTYDMLGNAIWQSSMDAGERWTLTDVSGKPIRAWNSRGSETRTVYDVLRRPTGSYLKEGAGSQERLVTRTVYGESLPQPELGNLRGKVAQAFDQAGVVTSDAYDFKGNQLNGKRRLAVEYSTTLNWSAAVPLETSEYTSSTHYDALNRPTEIMAPDRSVIRPSYNEANLMNAVEVNLRGELKDGKRVWTPFVTDLEYDAKGQRQKIDYGNGVQTKYEYDPMTFRLVRLITRRSAVRFPDDCPQPPLSGWPGCTVQNLSYTYDPSGNITRIRDDAQQTIYFRNRRVEPGAEYTYDAINRLIEATGREHLGQKSGQPGSPQAFDAWDGFHSRLSHPGDGNAMGLYVERYMYDAVGNILSMQHRGSDPVHPGWTRTYSYYEGSLLENGKVNNRLSGTSLGTASEIYRYDLHGNITAMSHLSFMQWDDRDQLRSSARQTAGLGGKPETTWYVYDASGQRVRKVTERQSADGQTPSRSKERIYLGGFEIYREYGGNGTSVILERDTLHIMDDKQRIAMVESLVAGNDGSPPQLIRYQHGNHLGSATLELDHEAYLISYEEYTPYGSTSYQAVRGQGETPKRYRYSGKERDEENGFYYHGARYYAPWLARWSSCDPLGISAGINLYRMVSGNPVVLVDPNGMSGKSTEMSSVRPQMRAALEPLGYAEEIAFRVKNPATGQFIQGSIDYGAIDPTGSIEGGQFFLEAKGNNPTAWSGKGQEIYISELFEKGVEIEILSRQGSRIGLTYGQKLWIQTGKNFAVIFEGNLESFKEVTKGLAKSDKPTILRHIGGKTEVMTFESQTELLEYMAKNGSADAAEVLVKSGQGKTGGSPSGGKASRSGGVSRAQSGSATVEGALSMFGMVMTIHALVQTKKSFDTAYEQAVAEDSIEPLNNELRVQSGAWGWGLAGGTFGAEVGSVVGPIGSFFGGLFYSVVFGVAGRNVAEAEIEREKKAKEDPDFARKWQAWDTYTDPMVMF